MRENGNTRNRPEQLSLKAILEKHLPKGHIIETEKWVFYKIDDGSNRKARLDIAIQTGDYKVAIRMMGPPHEERDHIFHDNIQKLYLEKYNWIVKDFWYNQQTNLWGLHKKPELYSKAVKEAKEKLGKILPFKAKLC